MHDVEFKGAAEMPRPYNHPDYGLPVWKDEDHLPPKPAAEKVETREASMTAEEAKRKFCLWAEEQLGYHEGDGNSNKYAETPGLSEMYGWNPQNQPWCDVFVDSGFISCFGVEAACKMTYQPMGAGSALCKQSAQYYKDNGAFYQRPEVGDQVFFYASGDVNHTGVVVRVVGGSIITVEGNSSDQVAERCYSTGDSKIAGYGRPDWAAVEGKDIDVPTEEPVADDADEPRHYELSFPYLSKGDTGDAVRVAQTLLQARNIYCGPYGADGDFGPGTEKGVRDFQRRAGFTPDGVIGPKTGAVLFSAEVYTPEAKEEPKASSFWDNLLTKIKKHSEDNV
jgi:hypothetical protein